MAVETSVPEFINNLLSLGRQRLTILGGTAIALLAAVFLGLSAVTTSEFTPIYKNLSISTANAMEASLSGVGFKVQVSENGSTISVPREDLARARMALAESGIPIDGEPGWELFDESSVMSMNSFLQKVNRLRAMEGELARSIQTLDGVQSARVHLVLPEREPFSRETPVPRASVIVRPTPGRALSRKQAIAVRNLVASAVAELDLTRVTILSSSGETILAETATGDGQVTLQSTKSAIEDRLSREIRDILMARVGAGNARVRVNVDLTSEREVIVEQSFDPDQQVVRSTENKTENQSGGENEGNVGVENNIPAALTDANGTAAAQKSKSGELIKYEIGNTRREVVREAGEVRRISVAVLVNGIYNVDGTDVAYSERDENELNRLEELVKSAVGFDQKRGDSVSVDSMRFIDYSMDVGEAVGLSAIERLSQNAVSIVRSLLALLIVALILIFGVRPLLRQLATSDTPSELANQTEQATLGAPDGAIAGEALAMEGSPGEAAQDARAIPSDATRAEPFEPETENNAGEYVETLGIKGNLLRARVEAIQNLADENPDEVLRVLRSWLLSEVKA